MTFALIPWSPPLLSATGGIVVVPSPSIVCFFPLFRVISGGCGRRALVSSGGFFFVRESLQRFFALDPVGGFSLFPIVFGHTERQAMLCKCLWREVTTKEEVLE